MNCVTWYEAFAFCIWDGGRLATDAELQYAELGGSENRTYPWGQTAPANDPVLAIYDCYYNGTGPGTCSGVKNIAPVGTASGNGKWGQADLGGNVGEWVLDWSASDYLVPCTDCANLTPSSSRVIRGGTFTNDATVMSQASTATPTERHSWLGARCARAL
jgi:formylglycine-generating enzyme required for sulfatase activity